MLTFYLIALAIGGTLLMASLVLGGGDDMEADVDVDAGADVDIDANVDVDSDIDVADADVNVAHAGTGGVDFATWLPLVSLRFWTFFAAFFGLTGVALTLTETDISRVSIGITSGVVGYVCGLGVMMAFRRMRRSQTSSTVHANDFIGTTATVVVKVAKGKLGKVRMELKGRTIESLATTEEDAPFSINHKALIYAVTDAGHVVLTHTEAKRD